MLSEQQQHFCGMLTCQYDYYLVYYYADYHEYTPGEIRDNKILVYCSDQKPDVVDGSYNFTDCNFYEITSNRSLLRTQNFSGSFRPSSSTDILYTNIVDGYPQFHYWSSEFRNLDGIPIFMFVILCIFSGAVIMRVIFGGK